MSTFTEKPAVEEEKVTIGEILLSLMGLNNRPKPQKETAATRERSRLH